MHKLYFLDQARNLYQQFLYDFERQLRNLLKEVLQHQYAENLQKRHEYVHYLNKIVELDNGLKILRMTKHKREAYNGFCNADFKKWLFDRYADEDLFYILLGLGILRVMEPN